MSAWLGRQSLTGESGSGKTTQLRSVAQLWPFTSGTVRCRVGENATTFLSQLPYVPLGDLPTVVSYPHPSGVIPDETFRAALESVALPRYTDRLGEVNDWAKVLSPGEQHLEFLGEGRWRFGPLGVPV